MRMDDLDWGDPATQDLAHRLAATDFSADSRIRAGLRARLVAGGARPAVPPARRLVPVAWVALALAGLLILALAGGWAGGGAPVQAATPTHWGTVAATQAQLAPGTTTHVATGVPTPAPTARIVATQQGMGSSADFPPPLEVGWGERSPRPLQAVTPAQRR
jgi:hypothetical protein